MLTREEVSRALGESSCGICQPYTETENVALETARDLYAEIDRQNQLITGFADALRQLTGENHKLQKERDNARVATDHINRCYSDMRDENTKLNAMIDCIDMRDLAPVTSYEGGWNWAHYCSETLHEHPTVPRFLCELRERCGYPNMERIGSLAKEDQ